ncbi:uncharacterized protein LOC106647946 isoform X2 [Copidosoma floridanum]|uniref:uncharacterized protein LOC106647946 isoform X2 n=1 Tax=Copidosoma floridanum TaxID=29053 RepID=UPI0006C9C16B|nr:uncharacterized protein LOC106647946 isoform X2 [Copidosoma floridanum]
MFARNRSVREMRKKNGTIAKSSWTDEEQPDTVEDHFKLIMSDNSVIDSNHRNITPDDLPSWFDERLFKIGRNYYTRNILGITSAYLAGLFAVFLVPSISKLLIATKRSSTPCAAFKRYLQTVLHVYNLHIHDYRDPDSKFYKSLNTIRWKHSTNSKCAMKRTDEGITQQNMVLTQYGFIGYVLLSANVLALTNEPEEREGINHFWRVVGKLLGIPDKLNLCRESESETTQLCERIKDEVYVKQLQAPTDDFFLLISTAIDGLFCVDMALDMEAFLAFFCDINNCKNTRKMSLYSKYNYLYRKFMFSVIKTPLIGPVVRSFWNVYFHTTYWFQERYPLIAWLKYGKAQSKITLYQPLVFK